MEKKEFLAAVEKEIISIKQNATTEEIGKLNIGELKASVGNQCIYGQMTGDCCSLRSKDLMGKGCTLVFSSIRFTNFENLSSGTVSRESNNSEDWIGPARSVYLMIQIMKM